MEYSERLTLGLIVLGVGGTVGATVITGRVGDAPAAVVAVVLIILGVMAVTKLIVP